MTYLINIFKWIGARLKEPSTHAALLPIFGTVGYTATDVQLQALGGAFAALSAVLAVFLPEGKK